jgi:hypothetical protein
MKLLIGLVAIVLIAAGGITGLAAYRAHLAAQVLPKPTRSAATSASTPTPTPTTAPTTAPTTQPANPPAALVGTYWGCTSDQTDAGVVLHSEDSRTEAQGGVRSAVCQHDMRLLPGAYAFRVPVGHFTPFQFCGITVANIIDPYQGVLAPSHWIAADELLYDQRWNDGAPSGTC